MEQCHQRIFASWLPNYQDDMQVCSSSLGPAMCHWNTTSTDSSMLNHCSVMPANKQMRPLNITYKSAQRMRNNTANSEGQPIERWNPLQKSSQTRKCSPFYSNTSWARKDSQNSMVTSLIQTKKTPKGPNLIPNSTPALPKAPRSLSLSQSPPPPPSLTIPSSSPPSPPLPLSLSLYLSLSPYISFSFILFLFLPLYITKHSFILEYSTLDHCTLPLIITLPGHHCHITSHVSH